MPLKHQGSLHTQGKVHFTILERYINDKKSEKVMTLLKKLTAQWYFHSAIYEYNNQDCLHDL